MKKHDFESLMSQYRDSLGSCSRLPDRKRKRFWIRPIASLGAAATVIVFAAMMIWPRDAAATAWEKMTHALKDVRHFQATGYQLLDGKWRKMSDVNYADGVWSLQSELNSNKFVCLASDKGLLVHDSRLPYMMKTPSYYGIDSEMVGNRSVLDYVVKHIEFGYIGTGRKQSLVDRGNTYNIVLRRQAGDYEAQIVVDKATDRPISAEVSAYADQTNRGERYRFKYKFEYQSVANPLLPNKPVVDIEKEMASLTSGWEKALASSKSGIVDACISSTGTIWLISAYDRAQKTIPLPYRLYAGGAEYRPMQFFGGFSEFLSDDVAVGGKSIAVMGFVTINPPKNPPAQCQVEAGEYTHQMGVLPVIKDIKPEEPYAPGQAKPKLAPSSRRTIVGLRLEAGPFPSYFTPLMLGETPGEMRISEAYARANYLRDLARYDEAIRAYEQIGKAVGNQGVIGYGWWKSDIDTAKWFKESERKSLEEARRIYKGERRQQ